MNWITYRNKLEKQMLLYVNFIPCLEAELSDKTNRDKQMYLFGLLDEIQYLKTQIQRVDRMSTGMASGEVQFRKSQRQSKVRPELT